MNNKILLMSFFYILFFAFLVVQVNNAVISFGIMLYGIMSMFLWHSYFSDEAKERGENKL